MLSTEYLWGSTHILMPFSSSCFSLSCFLENHISGRDLWCWGRNRWWTGRCQTHLGSSDTVSFWYNIWFFVQKKSLLWSYTDWSWKSRLSTTFLRSETTTGWVKKKFRGVLKEYLGPAEWSLPLACAQRFAGCWPRWMSCGGGSRVPPFGQYGSVYHKTSSVQKYDFQV